MTPFFAQPHHYNAHVGVGVELNTALKRLSDCALGLPSELRKPQVRRSPPALIWGDPIPDVCRTRRHQVYAGISTPRLFVQLGRGGVEASPVLFSPPRALQSQAGDIFEHHHFSKTSFRGFHSHAEGLATCRNNLSKNHKRFVA